MGRILAVFAAFVVVGLFQERIHDKKKYHHSLGLFLASLILIFAAPRVFFIGGPIAFAAEGIIGRAITLIIGMAILLGVIYLFFGNLHAARRNKKEKKGTR